MYIFTRFNMDYIYFFFPHESPRRYLVLVYVAHCSAAIEERKKNKKNTTRKSGTFMAIIKLSAGSLRKPDRGRRTASSQGGSYPVPEQTCKIAFNSPNFIN